MWVCGVLGVRICCVRLLVGVLSGFGVAFGLGCVLVWFVGLGS